MLSAWVESPECEGDHSFPCTAEVKHEWSFASLPPICLHYVDGEDFTSVVLKIEVVFQNKYFLVINMVIKWLLVKAHLVYLNLIFQLFFHSSFKHTLNQLVGKGGMSTFHSFYMFPL